MPSLLGLILLTLFLWGGFKFFHWVFSGSLAENVSSEITILRGRTEFKLENSEDWTRAYSEQKFISGDSLRTFANTRVSLELLDGKTIFLGPNTELSIKTLSKRSSGVEKGEFVLARGEIWAQIPEEKLLTEGDSSLVITTDRQNLNLRGGIFDLMVSENEDVIRLIRGQVDSDIRLDEETTQNTTIGVGQKLVLNPQTIAQAANEQNILEITDNEFLESDWHLENLEQFAPEEAAQIRRKIEISASKNKTHSATTVAVNTSIPAPGIITPADNTTILGSQESAKIEGSAPEQAYQISVNGYTLTKFQPGDRKWTYFASEKFGTLVPGANRYEIIATTRDGQRSAPAIVNINFDKAAAPLVVETSAPSEASIFPKPVITKPALIDPTQPYETSSEVVTIVGEVPVGTVRVTVNDFVLKKFQPGNTTFSYIANANYGNLKKGENVFTVNAYGPNDKTSETRLRIFYKPISL